MSNLLIHPDDFIVTELNSEGTFKVSYEDMQMFFYKSEFKDKTIMQGVQIVQDRIERTVQKNRRETALQLLTGFMGDLIQEPVILGNDIE